MPVFSYTAVNQADEILCGMIDGDSPRQARDQLRGRGWKIVDLQQVQQKSASRTWRIWNSGRQSNQVGVFTGELATLLAVGIPLHDCLDTLSRQYSGSMKQSVLMLKDLVASGKPLATAMGALPRVFDRLCIKMVEVGENTGNLDSVLRQLSDFKRKSADLKDRVLTAILYPLIILSISLAVSIFLMTFVIPMLLENLTQAGRPLPWPTRVLKLGSDMLCQNGWWVAILLSVLLIAAYRLLNTNWGSRIYYQGLLKIPLLGDLVCKQEISRVSLIISTLMNSGIEFLEAIEIGRGTSKNPLLQDALLRCEKKVRSGGDIAAAMAETSFFPPMVVQIYTVGQSSGQLDKMLMQLSLDFENQVDTMSARLSTIIEPVLILVLSLFVGFILFATLLPILEAGNVLDK